MSAALGNALSALRTHGANDIPTADMVTNGVTKDGKPTNTWTGTYSDGRSWTLVKESEDGFRIIN